MEEKPKMKTLGDEAPSKVTPMSVLGQDKASSLRNPGMSSNQSLVMQLQQATQMSNITGATTATSSTQPGATDTQQQQTNTATPLTEYTMYHHLPSTVMNQQNNTDDGDGAGSYDDSPREMREQELREQDRFLPIANVARIMKRGVPETGKIAKDAKECVQECVSEFISFITSEASERCQQEKRKTINGEDILFAMTTLGFDNYVEPLKVYLTKYRESLKGEKVLNVAEYAHHVDSEEQASGLSAIQYQIAGSNLHPSMVSADGTPYAAYTQAQINQVSSQIQFNT